MVQDHGNPLTKSIKNKFNLPPTLIMNPVFTIQVSSKWPVYMGRSKRNAQARQCSCELIELIHNLIMSTCAHGNQKSYHAPAEFFVHTVSLNLIMPWSSYSPQGKPHQNLEKELWSADRASVYLCKLVLVTGIKSRRLQYLWCHDHCRLHVL